ncbi:DUF4407 domain-containing protein [Microbispora sp. CA-102843]|uniref:DUF4407 domain-containing protein n=1 Tax=Microbispora sp. CA-102843 TaxID=3239952 RepID=UPI003D922F00
MRRFLIALSGAQSDVLAQCKTEYGKFEGIGGAVLTTSVLAVISMSFALHSALGVNLFVAIVVGLVWGLAIMSLDRWLVGTIRSDGPLRRRLFMAAPRIAMAVLLGFVISTPLVLQIFQGEINAQIAKIKEREAETFIAQQKQSAVGKDVEGLRKEVADLEKVVSSRGDVPLDPARDPKVKDLTAERANEQKLADQHYKEWQCQLYGGKSCPKKGDGPLAQDSKRAYDKNKGRIDLLNRQIEARRKELAAGSEAAKASRLESAQAALPKARAELDAALERQTALRESFDNENLAMNGLLIRLRALNEVTGKDGTLSAARGLLFLLFLLIECLPVFVKLMQRPGNYERVLALAEQDEFRRARGSFAARPANGSVPASAVGAEDRNLWSIWSRDSGPQRTAPPNPTTKPLTDPFARPGGPYDSRVEEDDGYRSPDDDALRRMPDTRTVRMPVGDRSDVELLPDDD